MSHMSHTTRQRHYTWKVNITYFVLHRLRDCRDVLPVVPSRQWCSEIRATCYARNPCLVLEGSQVDDPLDLKLHSGIEGGDDQPRQDIHHQEWLCTGRRWRKGRGEGGGAAVSNKYRAGNQRGTTVVTLLGLPL